MTPVKLTVVTSIEPAAITKRMELDAAGNLVKRVPPQMTRGTATVMQIAGLADLAAMLPLLSPAQALCFGVPNAPGEHFDVVTAKALAESPAPGQIARTNECFNWHPGPGILMLDHDPARGGNALSRDELTAALVAAVPPLAGVSGLWWTSASSCITHGGTGIPLTGVAGQRLYVVVKDACDIPRAGKMITERLWLAGLGYYEVSKSGALLERTLVDGSVWQPNRLDYAAGADCVPPLSQNRGVPVLLPGSVERLDTRVALPDLDPGEVAALETIKRKARDAVAGQVEEARRVFTLELANRMSAGNPEGFPQARVSAEQAVTHARLKGDFPLILDDGTAVMVGDVLDDREKYHGRLTRDPLEPDYNGGHIVGKLYLIGGRPRLHSFAHGGRTFTLIRAPHRVEVVAGHTSDLIDRTLETMRASPDLFDLGDVVASVDQGRVSPLTEATLSYTIGHEMQFVVRKKSPSGEGYEQDVDPPQKVIRAVLDMRNTRQLRPLDAVITAPTIRPDGTVLDRPGYDAQTRLFFDPIRQAIPAIPLYPSEEQVRTALRRLMTPFADFPFATVLDRSVMLAAVLTAAVRPGVLTSPGFAFDAPIQGSGKTLLARCVGLVACGEEPPVWPHVAGGRDAESETRKRLMTSLLSGRPALVWDNVVGLFDSASIAAFLTADKFSDRVLGLSKEATVPNRSLFLLTGNNISLAGELPRRFLVCRIDPQTEQPFARRFDLDPAAYCRTHRMQMVADALTVIRGELAGVARVGFGFKADGSLASFEAWEGLVRQTVAGLARRYPDDWRDPIESVKASCAVDPVAEQLGDLLAALHRQFGDSPFTAQEVARHQVNAFAAGGLSLAEAIEDVTGQRGSSAKTIGRVLANRKDRLARGLRLVSLGNNNHDKVTRWAVRA